VAKEVRRITRRERPWSAWAGSTAELERIGNAMAKLVAARREARIAEMKADEPKAPGPDEYATSRRRDWEGDLRRLEEITVRASLVDRNEDEVTGDISAVLAEFDRRTYRKVVFKASYPYTWDSDEVFVVVMKRDNPNAGVTLKVTSNDQGWAKQAMAEVSEEIDRGAQWWSFALRPWGAAAVNLAVYISVYLTALLIIEIPSKWPSWIEGSGCVVIAFVAGLTFSLTRLWSWTFPSIEIIPEGEKPKGARAFITFGSLIATAILGVAINTIR
jgi:hypothetical protein